MIDQLEFLAQMHACLGEEPEKSYLGLKLKYMKFFGLLLERTTDDKNWPFWDELLSDLMIHADMFQFGLFRSICRIYLDDERNWKSPEPFPLLYARLIKEYSDGSG